MRKILGTARWIRIIGTLCAFIGGMMNIFSGFLVPLLPKFTQLEIQEIGLKMALASLVLVALAATIAELMDTFTAPRLFLRDIVVREKPVYSGGVLLNNFDFVFGTIVNLPQNLDRGQSAEHATIEIVFKSDGRDPVRIESARWSYTENPVFPQEVDDFRTLKSIDLHPNNPETFILVYRKKPGTNIYAFYVSDHTQFTPAQIKGLTTKRFVGEPPIDVTIAVRGRFAEKIFNCVLSVDRDKNFVFNEKKLRRKQIPPIIRR